MRSELGKKKYEANEENSYEILFCALYEQKNTSKRK